MAHGYVIQLHLDSETLKMLHLSDRVATGKMNEWESTPMNRLRLTPFQNGQKKSIEQCRFSRWYRSIQLLLHIPLSPRLHKGEHTPRLTVAHLGRNLLAKELLEGLTVLSELLDTLVELVESHSILEKLPSEFGLVVNVRNLSKRLLLGSYGRDVGVSL